MKFVAAIVSCASLFSCGIKAQEQRATFSEKIEGISIFYPEKIRWQNPERSPHQNLTEGHDDLRNVSEGLTLVDKDGKLLDQIDTKKKIVIYIHGWHHNGYAASFPFPHLWNEEYNTFVFRWHGYSFNKQWSVVADITENVPKATKFLRSELDRLYKAISKNYPQEIRYVGYSMGAVLASEVAYDDFMYTNDALAPRRLELLDPSFFQYPFTPDRIVIDYGVTRYRRQIDHLAGKLAAMRDKGVAIAAYTSMLDSVFGGLFTSTLYRDITMQKLDDQWMNSDDEQQHYAVVPYYFESIAQPLPLVAGTNKISAGISAAFPTSQLRHQLLYLVQKEGGSTMSVADDVYEFKETCARQNYINIDRSLPPVQNMTVSEILRICL